MTAIPPNPEQSEMQFQQWLERMPDLYLAKDVTVTVRLTMNLHYWVLLLEGAMRNGMSLKEALEFLLLEYNGNQMMEWSNRGCETAEERQVREDDEGNDDHGE
jgi:hypothetical protein